MRHTILLRALSAIVLFSSLTSVGTEAKDAPCVWLSNDVVGMQVVSEGGDPLGRVEDIVVHSGAGSSYAVLSFGPWFGPGEKRFAMPWGVLSPAEGDAAMQGSARTLVLRLDQARLRSAPVFDAGAWPSPAEVDWMRSVDAFYAGDVLAPIVVARPLRLPPIAWRATKLRGVELVTPKGDRLGGLEQIAIDTNGRVSFATVVVGPRGGFAQKVVAVPWDVLVFTHGADASEEKRVTLDTTLSVLELTPLRTQNHRNGGELCDPKWIARLYEYYACPPYWKNMGERVANPVPAH